MVVIFLNRYAQGYDVGVVESRVGDVSIRDRYSGHGVDFIRSNFVKPREAYIVCDFYVRMFLVQDRKYFEANSAPLWWQISSQVQWMLMPLADFIFAAVAALDAQLHMAIWPKNERVPCLENGR